HEMEEAGIAHRRIADAFGKPIEIAELGNSEEVLDLLFPVGGGILVALHATAADHHRSGREFAFHPLVESGPGDAVKIGKHAAHAHALALEVADDRSEPF